MRCILYKEWQINRQVRITDLILGSVIINKLIKKAKVLLTIYSRKQTTTTIITAIGKSQRLTFDTERRRNGSAAS